MPKPPDYRPPKLNASTVAIRADSRGVVQDPRWGQIRKLQGENMSSQSWGELSARIGVAIISLVGYIVVVNVMYGGAVLFWRVLTLPFRVLQRAFFFLESLVERPLRPDKGTVNGKVKALEAHQPSGVVNTFRALKSVQRARDPRELQLIYNAKAGRCLPPFDSGSLYPDPLFNRHIATMAASLRPYVPNGYYRETVHSHCDGATLCVDWMFARLLAKAPTVQAPAVRGIIGIVPGLASSSHSPYIETMCRYFSAQGYHAAVINARGMGSTPLDQPRILTGVFTADIRTVVAAIFDERRLAEELDIHDCPLFMVGLSLGASMLCKYLGEEGSDATTAATQKRRVKSAAACCAPWDFHESSENMSSFEAYMLYQPHLAKGLREYMERHIEIGKQIQEVDVMRLIQTPALTRTVQQIDEIVVAPHAGFDSKESYYTAATPLPFLEHVNVPLMCLTAVDDPITGKPPHDARWEGLIGRNPNICYVRAPAGGHLGFLMGLSSELRCKGNFMEESIVAHFQKCAARGDLVDQ